MKSANVKMANHFNCYTKFTKRYVFSNLVKIETKNKDWWFFCMKFKSKSVSRLPSGSTIP